MPVRVFCSYSHEDREWRELLEQHLSPLRRSGKIDVAWTDEHLIAGSKFDPVIREELDKADVILLLLSSSFFSSDYCWTVEARRAIERYEAGQARTVAILLRACKWNIPPVDAYTVIPRNFKPITSWPNLDEAFANIIYEVEKVIDDVEEHRLRIGMRPRSSTTSVTPAPSAERVHITQEDHSVFHCLLESVEPIMLRHDGLAELLPDIVLGFKGDVGRRPSCDMWLYANTNITSRLEIPAFSRSEATLLPATGHNTTELPLLRLGIRGVQSAANTIAFLHVPLDELDRLPPEERRLRVSNIRVNPSQLGLSTKEPAKVLLYLKVSDTTVAPNPQLVVGRVGGAFSIKTSVTDPGLDLAHLDHNRSLNEEMFGERKIAEHVTASITFTGQLAPVEPIGARTRLLLGFSNVPEGVALFATTEQTLATPGISASLTPTDANGNGLWQKPTFDGRVTANDRLFALSRVSMVSGSGLAAWELNVRGAMETQEVTVGIVIAYRANPSHATPRLGTCTSTASRGPLSTVMTSSATAPIPRFMISQPARNFFSIT